LTTFLESEEFRLNPHRVRGWGLKADQAKRLMEREDNSKRKRLIAELSLDKQVLGNLGRGNFEDLTWHRRAANHGRRVNVICSLTLPPPPEA
jgi:hypothetical protein